jgi:hypothetical protein
MCYQISQAKSETTIVAIESNTPLTTVMLPKLQEQSTQPGQQMFKAAA